MSYAAGPAPRSRRMPPREAPCYSYSETTFPHLPELVDQPHPGGPTTLHSHSPYGSGIIICSGPYPAMHSSSQPAPIPPAPRLRAGAADGSLKVWDRRQASSPAFSFRHHAGAATVVEWSLHAAGAFASAGEDRWGGRLRLKECAQQAFAPHWVERAWCRASIQGVGRGRARVNKLTAAAPTAQPAALWGAAPHSFTARPGAPPLAPALQAGVCVGP